MRPVLRDTKSNFRIMDAQTSIKHRVPKSKRTPNNENRSTVSAASQHQAIRKINVVLARRRGPNEQNSEIRRSVWRNPALCNDKAERRALIGSRFSVACTRLHISPWLSNNPSPTALINSRSQAAATAVDSRRPAVEVRAMVSSAGNPSRAARAKYPQWATSSSNFREAVPHTASEAVSRH